mgnify:FL=1
MIRKLNKINQVDFAERIGISQATLSELEQDKYKPSIDTVLSIVKAFGTNVEWLLFGAKDSETKVFNVIAVKEKEAELLMHFDKLKVPDQDEILDFIKLKISRY